MSTKEFSNSFSLTDEIADIVRERILKGEGSAPIAAAAAKTNEPVEQGLISMTGTFIDTIIICSLTGLSLLVSGEWMAKGSTSTLTQDTFTGCLLYTSVILTEFFHKSQAVFLGETCDSF